MTISASLILEFAVFHPKDSEGAWRHFSVGGILSRTPGTQLAVSNTHPPPIKGLSRIS